ncbi:MAG: hypothetical protein JWO02_3371, partial [Solirubrobacterales bacterium]|nr:hypothetical protein [Solirubrobacterales bacterium]
MSQDTNATVGVRTWDVAPPAEALQARPPATGPRSPAAWLVGIALLANLAVVVYLWLHGGGVTRAHTSAEILTSVGRVTGLLAAYSALVQVLLLARIPWF